MTKSSTNKITIENVLILIAITFMAIAAVELLIILYFTFAGITFLTLYLLLYEWISLFTKEPVHIAISILANFSDFGLFFVLSLICLYIIKDYFTLAKIAFQLYLTIATNISELKDSDHDSYLTSFMVFLMVFFPTCGLIILFIFVIMKWLFYVSVIFETLILLSYIIGTLIYKIKKKKKIANSHQKENSLNEKDESKNEVDSIDESEDEEESQARSRIQAQGKSKSKIHIKNQNIYSFNDDNEEEEEDNENQNFIEKIIDRILKKDKSESYSYSSESGSKDDVIDKIEYINDSIFTIASLEGMFSNLKATGCCKRHQTIYRIVISIIIFALQLYSILVPFLKGSMTSYEFVIYFIVKLLFGEKILAFNFIDLILNGKRVMKSLYKKKIRIVFWLVFVLNILTLIAFIVIFIVSKLTIFPTVERSNYYEDNRIWYKRENNQTFIPESFCSVHSQYDGSLKTEDFAMLTTLARLYDITKEGKCFIKPSKRGLFNTTMKYIFGKDYEKDNIRIFCKKLTHNPILILSSDKILNHSLSYFSNQKITLLENQFNIANTNYFDTISIDDIKSEDGKNIYIKYQNCTSTKGTENCENEWDDFSQFYWSTYYSDDYVDIPGFERYQISIDDNLIFQPSFIVNNTLYAGTHYIIGGSYEDSWGVGFFIETVGRKYVPAILENFLPLYQFIRSIAKRVFLQIEWFNKHIFYFDISSSMELKSIENLYYQFNFTQESLYLIGHSITGTAFKGISYFTDIQGITFEASDGENNLNFLDKAKFRKNAHTDNQITNIYSDGTIFTGNDKTCDVNGILPKRYILPSVYDTACLTSITCSETMKYVPLCKQVLTQNKKDPIEEFNISFNSYLKHYGYK